MSRPEDRPILPQSASMSNFSFVAPNVGVGDSKKNYVFVDEHNRHKRLKVMRACEGCRRRKIKCDAATTNSWPCAACVRLKLQCVPPTSNYNQRPSIGSSQVSGFERILDFAELSGDSGDEGYSMPQPAMAPYPHMNQGGFATHMMGHHPQGSYAGQVPGMPISANETTFASQATFPQHHQLSSSTPSHSLERSNSWPTEEITASDLSDVLGELKIDEKGMAPYIYEQKKMAEAPAVEEPEFMNLPMSTAPGSSVRIPPALMPEDDAAHEYFDLFFTNIHPYMPVISKSHFYWQWDTNRAGISPLLLEAIFACAGRLSDDAGQGLPWLALATKHETCFMDVPRLSTIQAMLLLLKAREANPKRGYYYRSWMSIKTISSMAKDLGLDEHYKVHQNGGDCGSDESECLVKTRIWQTVFISEMMIGGPQGRNDMSVDVNTVDFEAHPTPPGGDQDEYETSRSYVYFARAIHNVRTINDTYKEIKGSKDWISDPRVAALNPIFPKWLENIPPQMQVHYPSDGSPPMLNSHFVGNMHCYYHLSILILHRPQLMASTFSSDGSWKQTMATCYNAAKSLCRIQESILRQFGISGLLCMQRGINFAIYCVLTCTMIHLAAITSPDPEFNTDAKEYFTRHMRILEQCITAWPMRDLQIQVQSLREAFSADTNKTFQLKPSFPFASPSSKLATSPSSDGHYHDSQLLPQDGSDLKPQMGYQQPITPPISAVEGRPMMGNPSANPPPNPPTINTTQLGDDAMAQWNPSRLFDQWNMAFGTPASTVSSSNQLGPNSPSAMYSPTASTVGSAHDMSHAGDPLSGQSPQHFSVTSNMPSTSQMQSMQPSFASQSQALVSPAMWRDTVASTYVPNDLKRRWDDVGGPAWGGGHDHHQVAHPLSGRH